jgi:hypothetical protein
MYTGVPAMPLAVVPDPSNSLAMPKSLTLSVPSLANRMLSA